MSVGLLWEDSLRIEAKNVVSFGKVIKNKKGV